MAYNAMRKSKRNESVSAQSPEGQRTKRAKRVNYFPKPQRTGPPVLRGKRGSLANLLRMPLDIFVEIASHLDPLDLLHLARTSKFLRNILMSRSSIAMWRSARENIPDLPECHSDLSEPQYARLVFDKSCYGCGAKKCGFVEYTIRARHCAACWDKELLPESDIRSNFPLSSTSLALLFTFTNPKVRRYNKMYYAPSVKTLEKELEALSMGDPIAWRKFKEDRVNCMGDIDLHASQICSWEYRATIDEFVRKRLIQSRRKDAIHAKIIELRYTKDEIASCGRDLDALVQKPKELTPQMLTNMTPKLIAILSKVRRIHLREGS